MNIIGHGRFHTRTMIKTKLSVSLLKSALFNTPYRTRRITVWGHKQNTHVRASGTWLGKCSGPVTNTKLDQHRLALSSLRCYSNRNTKLPMIYLFTKENCSLCDEAKLVLQPFMHRFTMEEVDITLPENADWYKLYRYDIPVFHIYEDFLFKHRVDLSILEDALQKYETEGTET